MRVTWDEHKRRVNLKDHALDFADAEQVFAGATFTMEDDRFTYKEHRFETLGLLNGIPVSIIHTESENVARIISFRKATTHETQILFDNVSDQLPPPTRDEGRGHQANRRSSRGKPKARRTRNRKGRSKARST